MPALAVPSTEWEDLSVALGVNPALLQSGRVTDHDWQLLVGSPWRDGWNVAAAVGDERQAVWIWSCCHDPHRSGRLRCDPGDQQPGVASGLVAHQPGRCPAARTDHQVRLLEQRLWPVVVS